MSRSRWLGQALGANTGAKAVVKSLLMPSREQDALPSPSCASDASQCQRLPYGQPQQQALRGRAGWGKALPAKPAWLSSVLKIQCRMRMEWFQGLAAFGAAASWALVFFCTPCMAVPTWPRCRHRSFCSGILDRGAAHFERKRRPGHCASCTHRAAEVAVRWAEYWRGPFNSAAVCIRCDGWAGTDVGVEGEGPGLATGAPGALGSKASCRFAREPGAGECSGPVTDWQCRSAVCGCAHAPERRLTKPREDGHGLHWPGPCALGLVCGRFLEQLRAPRVRRSCAACDWRALRARWGHATHDCQAFRAESRRAAGDCRAPRSNRRREGERAWARCCQQSLHGCQACRRSNVG